MYVDIYTGPKAVLAASAVCHYWTWLWPSLWDYKLFQGWTLGDMISLWALRAPWLMKGSETDGTLDLQVPTFWFSPHTTYVSPYSYSTSWWRVSHNPTYSWHIWLKWDKEGHIGRLLGRVQQYVIIVEKKKVDKSQWNEFTLQFFNLPQWYSDGITW